LDFVQAIFEVEFMLLPLHPIAYAGPVATVQVERELRELGRQRNIANGS
jgi:hypothetical protein